MPNVPKFKLLSWLAVIAIAFLPVALLLQPSSSQIHAAPNVLDTLVPAGSAWKYLDNGTDQGTAWRGTSFDDSAWTSGPAPLGYGDPVSTTVGYGPDPNNRYITTYFRQSFTVASPALYTNLIVNLRRDDGAVVYLNGVEIVRSNMPAGTITYTTRANSNVGGVDETTFVTVIVPTTTLQAGANVLAVEVHQFAPDSTDIVFDLSLQGTDQTPTATSTPTNTPTAATGVTPTPAPGNLTLVSAGSGWKYLDNGSDQGTVWRGTSFDDSTWASGLAPLGYSVPPGDPISTTVSFGPDANNKYITTYFRKSFVVGDTSQYTELFVNLRRDDGAIVYLNGTEVVRSNMPADPITYTTRAITSVIDSEETTFFAYSISLGALQPMTNVLAVELHQAAPTTSDAVFDLSLVANTASSTATPTATSTPTSILTSTPTNTPTVTSTPISITTPTPTSTVDPLPNKVYLPVVVK